MIQKLRALLSTDVLSSVKVTASVALSTQLPPPTTYPANKFVSLCCHNFIGVHEFFVV